MTYTINIDTEGPRTPIDPMLYGQFIEQLGSCINGGVFEPGSSLADAQGYRLDVLEKARELRPAVLRWPGGTVTKIYHWQDGVGPNHERRARPNLIWRGDEDNLFGTNEFIQYCRRLGAEPYLSVNMGTGSAEEASHWVEYCNGTGNTHFANLRREHGHPEPHRVKFWGLGNEEDSEFDCGRLQNPADYAAEAWRFAKLMKLQDPQIKLIVAGTANNPKWNTAILESLHPIADYLSAHWYFPTHDYALLLTRVSDFEKQIKGFTESLGNIPESAEPFSPWYRFPARQGPVKLAIDEWGLWNVGEGQHDLWGLNETYTWQDALGVASWLNAIQRHAGIIGMATWAQMVNIIAPILADTEGSVRQTVFYPLAAYAQHTGRWNLPVTCVSPPLDFKAKHPLPALDATASLNEDGNCVTLAVVNRHPTQAITATIHCDESNTFAFESGHTLSDPTPTAKKMVGKPSRDSVQSRVIEKIPTQGHRFPPSSLTMLSLSIFTP